MKKIQCQEELSVIQPPSVGPTVATTSNGASGRGYKAVVPVDGPASEDTCRELYGIYDIVAGGPAALTQNVTVTRGDLIKFRERAPIFTIAPAP